MEAFEGNHDSGSTPTSSLIGVAICVAGNTCISLALNIQKLAHNRLTQPPPRPSSERSPLLAHHSDFPSRPTPLQTSVSDPNLANTDSSHVLIPVAPAPSTPTPTTGKKSKRCSTRPQLEINTRGGSSASVAGREGRKKSAVSVRSSKRGDSLDSKGRRRPRTDKVFLREPLWWLGIGLMTLGEFGNFLSYSFAPASLVAPLGSVALVANVVLAPLIVREPFRRQDLFGCFLAFLGGATVVYASKSNDKKLYPEEIIAALTAPLFLVYSAVCIAAIIALVNLSRTRYGDKWVMIDLGICALSGGFTVLATKAFSSFLTLIFLDTFRYWITYPILLVLVSTAFIQVNFINKALQRFESRVVIPSQFMSFALSTIVGSAVLYREFDDVDLPSFLNFAFGCLLSGGGVYLLTRDTAPTPSSTPSASSSDTLLPKSYATPTADRTVATPLLALPNADGGSLRARKLSLTLGGTQYLLAHSPASGSVRARGRGMSDSEEESGNDSEEEQEDIEEDEEEAEGERGRG